MGNYDNDIQSIMAEEVTPLREKMKNFVTI